MKGRVDISIISPPPSPSPVKGEGMLFTSRQGGGNFFAPSPHRGEGRDEGD